MALFSDINNKVALKFTVPYHTHPDMILSLHSLFEKLIVAHLVTNRLFPDRLRTNVKVEVYICFYFAWVANLIPYPNV
jgi:hypothetical protein